jgi:hypothetical protein
MSKGQGGETSMPVEKGSKFPNAQHGRKVIRIGHIVFVKDGEKERKYVFADEKNAMLARKMIK